MTLSPDQVRVFQTGEVWVAPTGTTLPTTLTGALDPLFDSLGYTAEDGVTIAPELGVTEIMAWQSRSPIRIVETSRVMRITVPGFEFNDQAVEVYFGGGAFSSVDSTTELFTPPDPGTVTKWACVFDTQDGIDQYRWVFDQVVLTEVGEISHVKDSASTLQVTLTALAGTDGDAGWRFYRTKNATTS